MCPPVCVTELGVVWLLNEFIPPPLINGVKQLAIERVVIVVCLRTECSLKHPCEGLDKHAHFRNFGMAFLTLFRVATGDNWNGIMKVRHTHDSSITGPVLHTGRSRSRTGPLTQFTTSYIPDFTHPKLIGKS